MEIELGIDEAGRGPVLGPLVMAGVWADPADRKRLAEWGVQDSKRFGSRSSGRRRRRELAHRIKQAYDHQLIVIDAGEVDDYVARRQLNRLEQETACRIIRERPADRVILDGASLFRSLGNEKTQAFDRADGLYATVAAASILAKDERDRLFERLCDPYRDAYGDVSGGGYANFRTLAFVEWHLRTCGELPPFYRRQYHWRALEEIIKRQSS
jgi:ribonuclease HII